ncbi:MAG: hypothetical protein H3C25_10210 [Candidatus Brocadia sapporoensis]|nr:hypothetical protein [Candidatus Brocadia sapporoensis]QQR65839.1 MAG: hypothetical protein IPI25_09740 [Candidatus Brocadia sp.]
MPEINRFNGIAIVMNHNNHELPHFHTCCPEWEFTVEVKLGNMPEQTL